MCEHPTHQVNVSRIGVLCAPDSSKIFGTPCITPLKLSGPDGIRGVAYSWFKSYLTGRSQYVAVNGYTFEPLPLGCEVPQGSVFGRLLFLIYMNDLPNISKHLKSFLFADDINILT